MKYALNILYAACVLFGLYQIIAYIAQGELIAAGIWMLCVAIMLGWTTSNSFLNQ